MRYSPFFSRKNEKIRENGFLGGAGSGAFYGKKRRPFFRMVFLYPFMRFKKTAQLSLSCFYTPKRFWTAVAGMKIPSPRPLDDRGVLCEDKYRIF